MCACVCVFTLPQFEMYVVGFQECAARDEWVRAITLLLNCSVSDLPAVMGPGTGAAKWGPLKPQMLQAIEPMPGNPT